MLIDGSKDAHAGVGLKCLTYIIFISFFASAERIFRFNYAAASAIECGDGRLMT